MDVMQLNDCNELHTLEACEWNAWAKHVFLAKHAHMHLIEMDCNCHKMKCPMKKRRKAALTIHFYCNVLTHRVAKEDSEKTIYLDWFLFLSARPLSRTRLFNSDPFAIRSNFFYLCCCPRFSLWDRFMMVFGFTQCTNITSMLWTLHAINPSPRWISLSSPFNGWIDDRLRILCAILTLYSQTIFHHLARWIRCVALLRTLRPL